MVTTLSKMFCFFSEVGSALRGKIDPHGSQFFPFSADLFSEGGLACKVNGKSQILSPVTDIVENLPSVACLFKTHTKNLRCYVY